LAQPACHLEVDARAIGRVSRPAKLGTRSELPVPIAKLKEHLAGSLAEPGGRFHDLLDYPIEIRRGCSDHLQRFGRSGLLSEARVKLGMQPDYLRPIRLP